MSDGSEPVPVAEEVQEDRTNDWDRVQELIAWIEGHDEKVFAPAIGEAVIAMAKLETAMKALLLDIIDSPYAWTVVHPLFISQVLHALKRLAGDKVEALEPEHREQIKDLAERTKKLTEPRNTVVHGVLMPIMRRGVYFISHRPNKQHLSGGSITVDEIQQVARDAAVLEDVAHELSIAIKQARGQAKPSPD